MADVPVGDVVSQAANIDGAFYVNVSLSIALLTYE